MNYSTLKSTLSRIHPQPKPAVLLSPSGEYLSAGLEDCDSGTEYHWDGLSRRSASRPFVIFQYSLCGWGTYTEAGLVHRLTPGRTFAAIVPSDHVYRLPEDSPGWAFFWVMFNHPYAVARMDVLKATGSAVSHILPDSIVAARLVRLFEGICQQGFRDEWAQEQALFEFLWEYERYERGRRFAPPLRDALLAEVRLEVLQVLTEAMDVAELAERRGMSRSHFSHHFRAMTGLSPGRFITQVRLEQVANRLLNSNETLAVIAEATGFADSNHLCKVFRRHYHISPGIFRNQMR